MVQADMYRKLADSREDEIMHLQSKFESEKKSRRIFIHPRVASFLKLTLNFQILFTAASRRPEK